MKVRKQGNTKVNINFVSTFSDLFMIFFSHISLGCWTDIRILNFFFCLNPYSAHHFVLFLYLICIQIGLGYFILGSFSPSLKRLRIWSESTSSSSRSSSWIKSSLTMFARFLLVFFLKHTYYHYFPLSETLNRKFVSLVHWL